MSGDRRPARSAAAGTRSSSPLALAASTVSKSFGGVTVLDRFSLDIEPGEIHGLVGENGSGKSTLVKVLAGMHTPDSGSEVMVWGQPLRFPVTRPQSYGLAVVHQDMGLVDTMTVAENIGVPSSFGSSRADTRLEPKGSSQCFQHHRMGEDANAVVLLRFSRCFC